MSEVRSIQNRSQAAPLLIAYDGSASAKQAITAAAALMPGRPALIVTVWESLRDVAAATRIALPDDVVAQGIAAIDLEARDKALEIAAEGERLALTAGLHAETVAAERHGGVAATLIAEADAHDVSVLVVGSRGLSAVRSTVLGSVAYGLLHATRRPTLVVRDRSTHARTAPEGPVVVCYDGSASARHAAEVAAGLLRGVRALVVHCWEPVDDRTLLRSAAHPILAPQLKELTAKLNDADRERAEAIVAEGAAVSRAAGLEATSRIVGENQGIWETLAGVADQEEAPLVVVGSRGRSSWSSLVIGSVSHGLLHHLGRPLLVVPPPGPGTR